jgi:hypothetical protein
MKCDFLGFKIHNELIDPIDRDRVNDLRGYLSVVRDLLVEFNALLTHFKIPKASSRRHSLLL